MWIRIVIERVERYRFAVLDLTSPDVGLLVSPRMCNPDIVAAGTGNIFCDFRPWLLTDSNAQMRCRRVGDATEMRRQSMVSFVVRFVLDVVAAAIGQPVSNKLHIERCQPSGPGLVVRVRPVLVPRSRSDAAERRDADSLQADWPREINQLAQLGAWRIASTAAHHCSTFVTAASGAAAHGCGLRCPFRWFAAKFRLDQKPDRDLATQCSVQPESGVSIV